MRGAIMDVPTHTSLLVKPRKCDVCAKIAAALMGLLPKHSREDLGTFEEVMLSTKCQLHPRMFRSLFRSRPDDNIVERFSVCNGGCAHGNVYLKGETSDHADPQYAFGLQLFGPTLNKDHIAIRNILDPEWIDHSNFYGWKLGCDSQKNVDCKAKPEGYHLSHYRPDWLIDTKQMRLTPGDIQAPYVALSYVWGRSPFFKTTKRTLAQLQVDNALSDASGNIGIPKTIKHAMAVVGLLKERYLWVDAICIIQDDDDKRDEHIYNMATIFTNATVTIIADQGEDADFGLRGLRGISQPRKIRQEIFKLEEGVNVAQCQRFACSYRNPSTYSKRGWTFQEDMFSRRKLIFKNETVQWRCACSKLDEDCEPHYGSEIGSWAVSKLHSIQFDRFPNLDCVNYLVRQYNRRTLTYPENALAAFAGTLSVLSQRFYGGFVCGIPVLFFDVGLCWRPNAVAEPRVSSTGLPRSKAGLPSWSWVGSKCDVSYGSWWLGYDYIKKDSTSGHDTAQRIIPIIQWYIRKWNDTRPRPLQHTRLFSGSRTLYLDRDDKAVPMGWRRFAVEESLQAQIRYANSPKDALPRYFYKHESVPETEFWYPIPFCTDAPGPNNMLDTLLSCHTQRVRLFIGERISVERLIFSVRDRDGGWIGALQMDYGWPPYQAIPKGGHADDEQPCELVSISRAYVNESSRGQSLDEWGLKERPRESERYEFYNVLWVEWLDGIAYRKGLGRIVESAWEKQEHEWIDLTLG